MKPPHTTPVAREKSYSRFDLWEKVEASATLHGRIQNNNIEQLQCVQPSQRPHHLEHLHKMCNGNDLNRESPLPSQPGGDTPVTHPAAVRPRVHDPQGSIAQSLNSASPSTPAATWIHLVVLVLTLVLPHQHLPPLPPRPPRTVTPHNHLLAPHLTRIFPVFLLMIWPIVLFPACTFSSSRWSPR